MTPFFVGYLPAPRALRAFLLLVSAALLALFAGLGWAIGTGQPDPGPGAFRFDYGRQTVTGLLDARPYPVLHVTQGTEALPPGTPVLISGNGKTGVQDRADPLDGRLAQLSGPKLERGDLSMIQAAGGTNGLAAADGAAPQLATEDLGRWRLQGEICDGKCYAGAMRPGTGLAHRACANLCLIGGIPPVFVSSRPVEGQEFLLIGGPDGGPLPQTLLDLTALYISIEGRIERRGTLLVFLADPATARPL